MKGTDQECFPGVTHFTQVDVQPGGINIQHVEHLYQADFLKSLGIELEVKRREAGAAVESEAGAEEPVANEEEAQQEGRKEVALPARIRRAIEVMQQEEVLRYKYDYAWLKVIMDSTEGLPSFRSAQSFVDYLKGLGVAEVPSESSISRYMDLPRGRHPQWTFADTSDGRECQRRNLVASRFLSLVRKVG